MPISIINALVKAGVVGAVLAWSLIQNDKNTDRLFRVIENNTAALNSIKNESCRETCAEVRAIP